MQVLNDQALAMSQAAPQIDPKHEYTTIEPLVVVFY